MNKELLSVVEKLTHTKGFLQGLDVAMSLGGKDQNHEAYRSLFDVKKDVSIALDQAVKACQQSQ